MSRIGRTEYSREQLGTLPCYSAWWMTGWLPYGKSRLQFLLKVAAAIKWPVVTAGSVPCWPPHREHEEGAGTAPWGTAFSTDLGLGWQNTSVKVLLCPRSSCVCVAELGMPNCPTQGCLVLMCIFPSSICCLGAVPSIITITCWIQVASVQLAIFIHRLSFPSSPSSNSEISLIASREKPTGESSFFLLQKTPCPFSALPWSIGLYSLPELLPGCRSPWKHFSHMLYCQGTAWPCSVVAACGCVGGKGQRGPPAQSRATAGRRPGDHWGLWVRSCWPARSWALCRSGH